MKSFKELSTAHAISKLDNIIKIGNCTSAATEFNKDVPLKTDALTLNLRFLWQEANTVALISNVCFTTEGIKGNRNSLSLYVVLGV